MFCIQKTALKALEVFVSKYPNKTEQLNLLIEQTTMTPYK